MPPPYPPSSSSRQSCPGALCSQWGRGQRPRTLRTGPGWTRRPPKISLGFHTGSQKEEEGGARGSAVLSRPPGPFATCHTRRKPAAGKRDHLQPGLENSRFGAGSATRAPADGDFRAPAMRSAGFKTDIIPQPARAPPPNPRGLSAPEQLSRLAMSLAGGLGLREGAFCGLAKPLRQVFLLSFARRRARVLFATRGLGSPKELSPRKAQAAALRSKARGKKKKTLKKKKKKRKRKKKWIRKKVRLKPIGRGSCWLQRRWPQTQPSPGVWWRRRRRRRRRAPPRSCSTLWGGKAARNLPDPLLRPPPSALLPPPSPSLLQAFTTFLPKPAASTDLSNGWQRSRGEMKPGEQCKGS